MSSWSSRVRKPQSACGPTPWASGPSRRLPDVADELAEPVGLAREGAVEVARGRTEGGGERAGELRADPAEQRRPRHRRGRQLGQGFGPLVGPAQQVEGRVPVRAGERLLLGAEVELLARVRTARGDLVAQPGVAAEVRGPPVVQREPVGERQREEPPGQLGELGDLAGGRAVVGELEEADLVQGAPQVVEEGRGERAVRRRARGRAAAPGSCRHSAFLRRARQSPA